VLCARAPYTLRGMPAGVAASEAKPGIARLAGDGAAADIGLGGVLLTNRIARQQTVIIGIFARHFEMAAAAGKEEPAAVWNSMLAASP